MNFVDDFLELRYYGLPLVAGMSVGDVADIGQLVYVRLFLVEADQWMWRLCVVAERRGEGGGVEYRVRPVGQREASGWHDMGELYPAEAGGEE